MEKDCIAVIAAEEQELAGLEEFLDGASRIEGAAGCSYLTGEAGCCRVVAMRCGIGKVNAAIGTQAMIDAYHPRVLINIGAAGGLDAGLEVYDVVISTDAVQHDMDVTALGYAPGVVPDQKESYFQADPGLIREAREAGEAEGLRVFEGRIASGDLFVADETALKKNCGGVRSSVRRDGRRRGSPDVPAQSDSLCHYPFHIGYGGTRRGGQLWGIFRESGGACTPYSEENDQRPAVEAKQEDSI